MRPWIISLGVVVLSGVVGGALGFWASTFTPDDLEMEVKSHD